MKPIERSKEQSGGSSRPFETLFNKRDYAAPGTVLVHRLCTAQRAHRPGTGGLLDLIKSSRRR